MKKTYDKGKLMSIFKYLLLLLSLVFISVECFAHNKLANFVKFNKTGTFSINSHVKAYIQHFGPEWTTQTQSTMVPVPGQPKISSSSYHVEGHMPAAGSKTSFYVIQDVMINGLNSLSYKVKLSADKPVECKSLALTLSLPVKNNDIMLEVDDKTVILDNKLNKKIVYNAVARRILITLPDCEMIISGKFKLFIQGKFPKRNYFSIRISPENMPHKLKAWKLELNFKILPFSSEVKQLAMEKVLNMGFKDNKANDDKGGWTDQGPENDLRMFSSGKRSFLGIDFNIIDPKTNQGKSCLVLSGNQRKFPKKVLVKIKEDQKTCRYLYLLHASAWTPSGQKPVGKIIAKYRDGSRREIPVIAWKDCGNWWNPYSSSNANVVWAGKNFSTTVGLYLSRFRIGEIPEKLIFESGKNNVWMIVAATFTDHATTLVNNIIKSKIIKAGNDWIPLEFNGKIISGSPLDFSGYLDSPAGKYGPVIITNDGHFAFKDTPSKRIRFFGPNLVSSANFLCKKEVDDFVQKMVRMGYNTVRLHHFENGLLKRKSADSLTFNPNALDKINYLFAELKKHGIYISIDLYASRLLKRGDNIKECNNFKGYEMKSLAPISPSAFNNWKTFARKLLTQKNPYTGLSWAEDPALYSLSLINEAPLVCSWRECPEAIIIYKKKFVEYLNYKKVNIPQNSPLRDGLFIEFLNMLQANCIDRQIRFLREDIKLTALITDLNRANLYSFASLRNKLDFVDNHQYWDHPRFAGKRWSYPYLYNGKSAISESAKSPRLIMPTRIFGKPFTVTEFNFCNPNPYRMECAPLIGGYAGLQDWDALYRFAWSHRRNKMIKHCAPSHFDIVNNPQALLAERIIYMLFMRGDVQAAKSAFAFTFSPEQVRNLKGNSQYVGTYPTEFSNLGLYARIGSISAKQSFSGVQKLNILSKNWRIKLPESTQKALARFDKNGKMTSATGQIYLNKNKRFLKICTAKSEVMTFKGDADGEIMKLRNANRFQTVAAMSLDNLALKDSSRILLIQLVNMAATGQIVTTSSQVILEKWGKLPILLEKAKVNIELKLPAPMKVRMLKLDGSFNGDVQSEYKNGSLIFTANTAAKKGGVMAYLLTRQ